jgi:hypothetical protein
MGLSGRPREQCWTGCAFAGGVERRRVSEVLNEWRIRALTVVDLNDETVAVCQSPAANGNRALVG